MTVGLIMIVKNEEKTLPRLAASVKDQIDHWTVVDTGSTDATLEVLEHVFDPVPGEVHRREWEGFGPNKNQAIELAEPHTDWLLWLDADEELGGTIEIFDEDITDWIEIEERNGDLHFWKPRLFKSNRGFRFTGRTHEYLSSPLAGLAVRNSTFWVVHHADGGSRHEKLPRDLQLLQSEWEEQNNPRTAFYLARTFHDAGQVAQAEQWYKRVIGMGGWDEEIFYSRYQLGICLIDMGAQEEGCGQLWRAWGLKTKRAEPLVKLAEIYRVAEQWQLAWEVMQLAYAHCKAQPGNFPPFNEGLFLDVTAANWRCAYEQSITAWYTGNKERGRMLLDYLSLLVKAGEIPEPYSSSVTRNLDFYQ